MEIIRFELAVDKVSTHIRRRIMNKIKTNKGSDDKYYSIGYLDMPSDYCGNYHFDNDVIYIQNEDYTAAFYKRATYFYSHNHDIGIKYDSELRKEASKRPDDESYQSKLADQDAMSPYAQREILNFYYDIEDMLDEITYDSEKTHNRPTYNKTMTEMIDKYKYLCEMEKMKQDGNKLLPPVQVAVDWWAKAISDDDRIGSSGDALGDTIKIMTTRKSIITPEQLSVFKDKLAKSIMSEFEKSDSNYVKVYCDYKPEEILASAMKSASIPFNKTPWKTNMTVKLDRVVVSEGFADDDVIIFAKQLDDINIDEIKQLFDENTTERKVIKSKPIYEQRLNEMVQKRYSK